jgi:TRAP-type C4-dicarboxylate transport system permease small subunit
MRALRLTLDFAYKACGVLAAIALASIAALMLAQIIGRFFNVLVPGVNEASAFLLAATSFLALAYSFRSGSHIRVSLFLHYLPAKARRVADASGVLLGILLVGFFSWSTWRLVKDSLRFGEVSDGLLAIPLAIPQGAMLLGLVMLTIALVEEFFVIVTGGVPSFEESKDVVLRVRDDPTIEKL